MCGTPQGSARQCGKCRPTLWEFWGHINGILVASLSLQVGEATMCLVCPCLSANWSELLWYLPAGGDAGIGVGPVVARQAAGGVPAGSGSRSRVRARRGRGRPGSRGARPGGDSGLGLPRRHGGARGCGRRRAHLQRYGPTSTTQYITIPKAQFTQDAEHLTTGVHKFWKTLSMGVFT